MLEDFFFYFLIALACGHNIYEILHELLGALMTIGFGAALVS